MINNLFKKINIDDFLKDELEIEIEKPNHHLNLGPQEMKKNPLDLQNINPDGLIRDYENIRILSMNPQVKTKIKELLAESKEDLQKIHRLLNNF